MNDCGSKRVVVLVDMDCFYCQVEVHHDQSLVGKPVAVVQYNSWRGGGIIAVNYEARAKGVNRHMRGNDAIQKCPDLNLVRVKELHGKADLSKYRTASQKVFEVLSEFSTCVQRASIDEAYVDLTSVVNDHIFSNPTVITEDDLPNTFVEGYSDQNSKENKSENMKTWLHDVYNNELQDDFLLRLTVGAMMVEKLRDTIFKKTGFRCSAGISNNKILAKLACGLHKPNQQTLLPPSSVPGLFKTIPIRKVRNLGGKLGNRVRQELNCEFMSDLAAIPLNDLRQKFDDKTCIFLYQISKGIDNEPVESRLIPKSIGSCKSFPLGLKVKDDVQHWLSTLMNDIVEKLEADHETNRRKATLMTVSVRYFNKESNLPTSQCGEVTTYNNSKLLETAYSMLCAMTENQKSLNWKNPLSFLGVAIGKFIEINTKSSIDSYFNKGITKEEKYSNIHLGISKNESCSSKFNEISEINTYTQCGEHQTNFKNSSAILTNQPSSLLQQSNPKQNETSTKNVKNIKIMFAQMKNSCNSVSNLNTKVQNLSEKKEDTRQSKPNMNSFFTKKLEITSLVKDQINNNEQKTVDLTLPVSSKGFFTKKLELISPSKNVPKNEVKEITVSTGSFSLKKLESVSPCKHKINQDSISVSTINLAENDEKFEDIPTTLLCERCDKMIDINQYDEHIDHHVAMELSKCLNAADIVRTKSNNDIQQNGSTKKKKNEISQKRKHNSKASGSKAKKPCMSISTYFKPILNP